MKAAIRTRYGSPEVVRVGETAKPSVKEGELLIKVRAATVNRSDCGVRAAKPFIYRFALGLARPKLTILGTEFAGEVEEVGPGVTAFRPGDRVFGFNDKTFGTQAQYMTIAQTGTLALVPEGLSYEEAAPSTEGSHYALTMIKGAKVEAGHRVLLNGATGAIGSAGVQLLRAMGAEVTATCDTKNLDLVRSLGATRVIDYTAEDFTKDPHRYDAVIDAVGKSTFGRCRRLLKPRGVYIASDVGPFWQNLLLALVTPLFGGRKVRFPIPSHGPATALYFKELIETGRFTPVIDRRYPLDEIVDAYRYVESGRKTGNVVIVVGHPD
ncbi:NAD(P)-dependent alcohol dehydrogenase [Sphaerisporangium sp. B11E5]|uniref:NAD(P)-dependent alcohol dehydrogenase n=1 Tax=Sphaerisporangium sp. B11E5 TaxID=3153563 RepID=UPI00325D6962